jgi:hypothetical protein
MYSNINKKCDFIFQTMKKKFFVLRREGAKFPARLEYYDTEKKLKSGQPPKR